MTLVLTCILWIYCALCFQVSFDFAVKQVLEQLRNIVKGEYKPPTPSTGKRKFGNIVFAAVSLPATEIQSLLHKVRIQAFFPFFS